MDYYFDKDKIKKEYQSEEKTKLIESKNISNTNNGTTKLTTQNTSTKNL